MKIKTNENKKASLTSISINKANKKYYNFQKLNLLKINIRNLYINISEMQIIIKVSLEK